MSPRVSIREQVTAAACALCGLAAPAATRAAELDTSLLYYTEGSRVTVNELVGHVRKTLQGDRVLGLGIAVDVMTGASANGAIPSMAPQTFTRASGRGGYVVLPGQTPLDDTFQDNRVALDATIETPLGRNAGGVVGAHASVEYDYRSAGLNATLTRDFDRRNTTVAIGGAVAYDSVRPEGGTPEPFAPMLAPGEAPLRAAETDRKIVADLLVGVTQVINRSTVARLNYTLSRASGYLTDPFKMLTSVSAVGDPVDYRFERRPDDRTRHSVYGALKSNMAGDVLDASYRFMGDDWGVRSHTAEVRFRHALGGQKYVQPQYRYYHQGAADFFMPYLTAGDPFPDHASADYRLDKFDAHTIAVKFGAVVGATNEVNVRIGYYRQIGERSPPEAMTSLAGIDLFRDVDAYVIQVGYSRLFD